MTKFIEQLWHGNLEPSAYSGTKNKEIKRLENLMHKNLKSLEDEMNEKAKDVFGRYNCCIEEYISILTEQAFCDGFSIAIKLMTEAYGKAEEIVKWSM